MRSLFLASTSWLENVCYLAKDIINAKIVYKMKNVNVHHKMKNVNVHHYLFLSETYEPVARGTCPPLSPPPPPPPPPSLAKI